MTVCKYHDSLRMQTYYIVGRLSEDGAETQWVS